ncbi:hypothetical protein [Polluticoccus soli]|uniref:hypothetical protein n=1 Tax=Polluticoccus soli TaxID=3034150 RepID=UPI0023E14F08|nr:hypothetical protein [Flavipsychrobacter sp. JY13-12]
MRSFALLFAIVTITSCKKAPSRQEPVVGLWKLAQSGFDRDGNQMLDGNEILFPADSTDYCVYNFMASSRLDVLERYKGTVRTDTGWQWVVNERLDSMAINTHTEFAGTTWRSFRVLSYDPTRFVLRGNYNDILTFERSQ